MNDEALVRDVRNDVEEDFKLNHGSLARINILHCIDIFESITTDKAAYYLYWDKDLWLFSSRFIASIADIQSNAIRESSAFSIYKVPRLKGHIEVNLDDYSPIRPGQTNENSSITLRFQPDGSEEWISVSATSYRCKRLAEIAKFVCGNL